MIITIIDTDLGTLHVLSRYLERLGHDVQAATSAEGALTNLSPFTDLVITAVTEDVDGFGFADTIAHALGTSPPRTLIMPGEDCSAQLEKSSPAVILGALQKPFSLETLHAILDVIEKTRTRCPGRVLPNVTGCRIPRSISTDSDHGESLCNTPDYATCAVYERRCGRRLRDWITMTAERAFIEPMLRRSLTTRNPADPAGV